MEFSDKDCCSQILEVQRLGRPLFCSESLGHLFGFRVWLAVSFFFPLIFWCLVVLSSTAFIIFVSVSLENVCYNMVCFYDSEHKTPYPSYSNVVIASDLKTSISYFMVFKCNLNSFTPYSNPLVFLFCPNQALE